MCASVVVSGCGKSKSTPAAASIYQPLEANACSTSQPLVVTDRPVRNDTIQIIKRLQRTIRRDCQGRVVSDTLELVRPRKQEFQLMPSARYFRGQNVDLVVSNRQTCDEVSGVPAQNGFTVVLNPGADAGNDEFLALDISRQNALDYTFLSCDPVREGRRCRPHDVLEQGTIVLSFEISEQQIPKIRDIKDRNCARSRRY